MIPEQTNRSLNRSVGMHSASSELQSVVAIGMPVGTFRDPLLPSAAMSIRCSGQFFPVGRTAFALWCAARSPIAVADVRTAAFEQSGAGQPEMDAALQALVGDGLLRSWSAVPEENFRLLHTLRIVPTGVGLGSIPDDPEQCRIVRDLELDGGGGTATVGGIMYSIWAACDGARSLHEASTEVSQALGINEDVVWEAIARELPALLAIRSCYLEVHDNG